MNDRFVPAQTTEQAMARIFATVGVQPRYTRGEKPAILALRDALHLGLETTRTNALMGASIAQALNVEWMPSVHTDLNKVTLDGLNALLRGASQSFEAGALRQLNSYKPDTLDSQLWADFSPAPSKIEAVNRISHLTQSGPEWLGPGSKEHKSVLINLARTLAPHLDLSLSKTRLGAALAQEFGTPWTNECESTGYTISLVGLNTLLAGAELRLGRLGADRSLAFGTPEEEGAALAAALLDAWRAEPHPLGGKRVVWDGRKSILWMKEHGATEGINQNEWQGFYWESEGRRVLNRAFRPNPSPPEMVYGSTAFDYSLKYVWDLKAHTEWWRDPGSDLITKPGRRSAPLNDQDAMNACIASQGLGFLMVGGVAVGDTDDKFIDWHRTFKASNGITSRSSNSGTSRARKSAFEPRYVQAFFFHNAAALAAAKLSGQLTGFSQGKQAPVREGESGSSRAPKYNLDLRKVHGTSTAIARVSWPFQIT